MNAQRMAMLQAMSGMGGGGDETPVPDTSETCYISSLSLLKMLKHGRAGVPLEVMGLMLGTFVDDYTVRIVDVFAMPQSGSAATVEAVDPVYQQKMLEMLKLTGRPETVVGWYHSHPGFGCWLSGTDQNTQQSFEQLHPRAVAVVIDPIQSVKGKVVIDAFRLVNPQLMAMGLEVRQMTSNLGNLTVPSIVARINGLGRSYYNLPISFRKNALEERMLQNLGKKRWDAGLTVAPHSAVAGSSVASLEAISALSADYAKRVADEETKGIKEIAIAYVGKVDPKKRLEAEVAKLMGSNIMQVLGTMVDTVVF